MSLLLFLQTAASCGSASSDFPDQTTVPEDSTEPSADITAAEASSVPDTLDLDGMVINFGYVDHYRFRTDIIGEMDGDVINEAIYARNREVEEKLNMTFNPIAMGATYPEAAKLFQATVMAGDDVYDIHSGHQSEVTKRIGDHYYVNMHDDPYISFDKPWWRTEYMKELCVGNTDIYFLYSDANLGMLKVTGCVFVNQKIYTERFGDMEDLYQLVLDGGWTLDAMNQYSADVARDLNGDGMMGDGDLFGFEASSIKSVDHFQYNCGIITTERDKDGIPVITLNNERTAKFAELFYKLYYECPGAKILTTDDLFDTDMCTMFANNEVLFFPHWFAACEYLREMEADYGIIPHPKLDEEQKEYKTLVHNGATCFVVPCTIKKEKQEVIGAVLDEMAYRSWKLVTPAYFNVALKDKYTRDNTSSEMLDMILESAYTNFGYSYSSLIGGIGILRDLAKNKTSDFASWYASKIDAARKGLDDLIALYMGE